MPMWVRTAIGSTLAGVDVLPVVGDLALDAGAGDQVVHPVEAAQHGRLAAAGRADQRGDLVLAEREVHVVDGVEVAVEDVEPERLHHGVGRASGSSRSTSSWTSANDRQVRRRRLFGVHVGVLSGGERLGLVASGHQVLWNLLRMKMASAFRPRIMTSSTMMRGRGRLLELLLRLRGQAVDLDRQRGDLAQEAVRVEADRADAQQQQRRGLADRPGTAPRMVPVAMPGTADGRVCRHVVCHARGAQRQRGVADLDRHGPDRLAGGDDDDRQDQQRQGDRAAEHDVLELEAR